MSRRRAYTLIELLISAAIFASVLLMAFVATGTVTRAQRQTKLQQTFYTTAQQVVQTIQLDAQYAQPLINQTKNALKLPSTCSIPPGTTVDGSADVPVPDGDVLAKDIINNPTNTPTTTNGPGWSVNVGLTSITDLHQGSDNAVYRIGPALWIASRDQQAEAAYRLFGFVAVPTAADPELYNLISVQYYISTSMECDFVSATNLTPSAGELALRIKPATNNANYPFTLKVDTKAPYPDSSTTSLKGTPSISNNLGQTLSFLRYYLNFVNRNNKEGMSLPVQGLITIRPYDLVMQP